MTKRDSWIVPLLTMVTCGFFVACSGYIGYAEHRNAQIVHELLLSRGVQHEDKSDEYNKLADLVGPPAGAAIPALG